MGEKRRSRRGRHGEQFVQLPYAMIRSQAWGNLSGNAVKVYLRLRLKFNGSNPHDLSLTYNEMKGILSPATTRKCFIELVETGFIDLVRQGGLHKQCNIFGLSSRWQRYGTQEFEHRTLDKWNFGGFREFRKKEDEYKAMTEKMKKHKQVQIMKQSDFNSCT